MTVHNTNSKSFFSTFLPNLQGRGPIGSAVRIINRLQNQVVSSVSTLGREFGGSKKKEEEMRRKSIKVVDLLQHSAELGNTDALFTLAQISLVNTHLSVHAPYISSSSLQRLISTPIPN